MCGVHKPVVAGVSSWLGAAAIVTGLILLGIPDLGWQLQIGRAHV